MWIRLNGKDYETRTESLWALCGELGQARENRVVILDGYQTEEDLPLHERAVAAVIEKGKLPPEDCLEEQLCARHTPGVYQKVRKARVAVAGLGGLGSSIALSLARTGVGTLHLVDFDVVEPSNLNRQQYRISHLGMPKAEALKQEIAEINPFVRVEAETLRVTEENAPALFKEDPIVCEAFDSPEVKAMLVSTLLSQYPEKALVAASGMAGYGSGNTIRTRRVMGNFYLCGDGETAAQTGCGLMAPRVSICAGHQANMILRLILGCETV
ncbi:sulfur carrier protein ThiS adenylyltransferase ThiF [Eubacterium sp. 1001713B170207_170306_E7]|uniref:sulfur carrier protein ThiS adenylyltransferase ThiF n=1 Tax=Eubacterium sp. 1001713B170207_170306_E7 TaxID=2787097 RepID=UPI00189B5947|nr:sulfur carrier protein ThiS adenylyltransferase ThiF [Eubacterium sp. 1001713B170207_170306_E7]